MAWQDDMGEALRACIDDLDDSNRKFSDENLERLLVVAAMQVQSELTFSQAFRADLSNTEIRPDPTLTATRDDSYVNLVVLKAACLLDRSSAITAAKQGIYVKDGSSSIDLRGILGGKLKLLEKGWCAVYQDAKFEYQTATTGGMAAGAAILSPFRLYAEDYGRRPDMYQQRGY